jgi:hypothetical protein
MYFNMVRSSNFGFWILDFGLARIQVGVSCCAFSLYNSSGQDARTTNAIAKGDLGIAYGSSFRAIALVLLLIY